MRWIITVVFVIIGMSVKGQTVQSDFLLPAQACLNQRIEIRNQSTNANSYEWDFCSGDLNLTPSASVLTNSYNGYGSNVDLIEQNGNHFGFFIGRAVGKIYRLDFGADINSQPVMVDIGNFGTAITNWRAIEIVKEDNNYFGFIVDTNLNSVYRFTFGTSLTNIPSSLELIYTGDPLSSPIDIKSVIEGTQRFLFIANLGNEKLVRIKFDQSFGQSSVITDYITITGAVLLGGISFIKEGTEWFCVASSVATFQVYNIKFNLGLEDTSPAVTSIAVAAPVGLAVVNDNNQYYVFVQSQNSTSSVFRLGFGNSLSNTPISEDLSNIGITGSNLWGFSMFRSKSKWIGLSTESNGSNIFRLQFPNNCISDIEFSTDVEPNISALNPGSFFVALTAFDSNGNSAISVQDLTVIGDNAPDIAILQKNICANNDVNFTSVNLSNDIIAYNWVFGDAQTSTIDDPTHQYTSSGDYLVSLQVTADNGCNNYVEKPIKIYDPPDAQFTLPPGLICTNNEFTFTNTTLDNFDGNLTYEWLVNDVVQSTARDFNYAFTAGGDQQVKLKTSIPGCSDELSQALLNVQIGPVVDFSFTGKCEDEEIVFTNASSGSISGYQWDFDNGITSTEVNPTETFSDYGNYQVSLITTGTNGCASTITKPVTIYSVPQTNFSIDLPPFSCAGSASQFNDLTPPMPDSNITSWAWSFGDPSNGSSSLKNPLYTYSQAGDYSVALSTSTNFGCSNTVQKTVTIFPSPIADFSFGPACVNQETQFTDLSAGDIKSWLWSIQGNTYTSPNPKHIFKSASAYNALLTVTGNNGCISQAAKSVNVPVPVSPDFSSSSTCASKPSVFDEVTKGGVDPAVSWTWSFASQGSGTGSPTEHVFSSTGNYSVTMNSTRQSGCTYSITKTIPITDAPKAQFSLFLESGAAPFTVSVTNASTKATKYLWKSGDPKQANSTAFVPSFTYVDLGDYTIELEAGNELGCKDYMQQQVHVVVPQINAAVSDFRLEVIPGSDYYSPVVTIENKSNVALINPTVNLDLSGNATVSQTVEAIIRPNELLPYRFTSNISPVSLAFACAEVNVSADEYAFDNRQCVNLEDENVSMIPYPNPASDELMLEWINNQDEPMEVVIYNAAGQTIISRKYSPALKGLNQVSLDVSALSAGIYFISYSIDGRTRNFRFSIVR